MLSTDVDKRLKAYQYFIAQEDSEEIAGIQRLAAASQSAGNITRDNCL